MSEGGEPKSFGSGTIDPDLIIPVVFSKPDVEGLLAEDVQRDNDGLNLRDAVAVPVGLGISNAGIWFDQSDGSRIWRLQVRVPEAMSLEPNFNQFVIPAGGEFFIFNDSGTQVFGAYTDRNNQESGRLSLEMVQGDILNFEYFEPSESSGEALINILDIGYRYRDVIGSDPDNENGGADNCQVDVACSEGLVWEDEIRSTVRIRTRINGQFFWCTGTIVNNTAEDCRPLILTSLRCAIDGNDVSGPNDFDFYRFYFNHHSEGCGGIGNSEFASMAGCVKLGDSNDNGGELGSDYMILELNNDIPQEYDPYYAGWNASGDLDNEGGVMIHHPAGGVKKISTYFDEPSSAAWGLIDTHWRVQWSATTNGFGVHELGSQGAGLFDDSGRLIGTLTGGASYCDEESSNAQELPDLFGKFSEHWTENPNPVNEKLKSILDPIGTNTLHFDGDSSPCVTDLSELERTDIRVFPNPASNSVVVSWNDQIPIGTVLRISDLSGRIIQQREVKGQMNVTVDLNDLEESVYFLTLVLPEVNSSLVKRIVVKR